MPYHHSGIALKLERADLWGLQLGTEVDMGMLLVNRLKKWTPNSRSRIPSPQVCDWYRDSMSLGALSTLGFAGCEVHAMIRVRALFEEGVSLAEGLSAICASFPRDPAKSRFACGLMSYLSLP